LEESFRLFSLLATMQIESFQQFRRFTEGASAIQSRNYKLVESLCRAPDDDRLDSAAYRSVPELRERVLQRPPNLDDAVWLAGQVGTLSVAERKELTGALHGFAAQLVQWRQTHYRLAVRMLGDRPGTGYTEGTPYLKEVRAIPVFPKSDLGELAEPADEVLAAPAPADLGGLAAPDLADLAVPGPADLAAPAPADLADPALADLTDLAAPDPADLADLATLAPVLADQRELAHPIHPADPPATARTSAPSAARKPPRPSGSARSAWPAPRPRAA
jgi:hypothetical protein